MVIYLALFKSHDHKPVDNIFKFEYFKGIAQMNRLNHSAFHHHFIPGPKMLEDLKLELALAFLIHFCLDQNQYCTTY